MLTAFQIGFDLCENDNQKFLGRVLALLPAPPTAEGVAAVASEGARSLTVPHPCRNRATEPLLSVLRRAALRCQQRIFLTVWRAM
ncbi:MAG: hypothetical protein ACK55I_25345, partial [bacterium]